MTVPSEAEWRAISDEILQELVHIEPSERLRFLQQKLSKLPEGAQEMVGHFVALAVTVSDAGQTGKIAVSRHWHISGVTLMALLLALALGGGGIYLVTIGDDFATSHIKVWSAEIQTTSVGVACMALGMFLFLFVALRAISKM